MEIKEKIKISKTRELLDSVQTELGRTDIGIKRVGNSYFITDINGNEINLLKSDEDKINLNAIVKAITGK